MLLLSLIITDLICVFSLLNQKILSFCSPFKSIEQKLTKSVKNQLKIS